MNSCCVFSCVAAISVAAGSSCFALAPTDFAKKVPISVSESGQTALGEKTAANVPVLVRLSEAIDGFKYSDLAADGSDLAFGVEDESGFTVYPHEIETWDQTGTSLVWVKVPTLAAATSFGMYYGNGAEPAVSTSETWSNYAGVWHLDETGTDGGSVDPVVVKNISPNGSQLDGEAFGGTTDVDGVIGRARRISDADKNNKIGGIFMPGDLDCTKFGGNFTVSGWLRHKKQAYYYDHVFYKKSSATEANAGGFAMEMNNTSADTANLYGGGNTKAAIKFGSFTDTWRHVTLVFNGKMLTAYANGEKVGSGTIIAATDGTKRFAFGNDVDGYAGAAGDISWKGAMDELRLSATAFDADYVALEYAAMADEDLLAFGKVQTLDVTMPVFASADVTAEADAFVVSYTLTSGAGSFVALMTDVATEKTVSVPFAAGETSVSIPSDSLAAGHVYACAIQATSQAGNVSTRPVRSVFNGTLSVAKTADAEEETLAEGSFTVTASAALPVDLTVAYRAGGTAVAGETYEALSGEVTIPTGATSATIAVKPVFSSAVTEDVTVAVTLERSSAFVATASAELTIVNAEIDPNARYVAPDGNDETGTGNRDGAFASVAKALSTLGETGGTIWLADGEYPVTATLAVTTPVTIRSISGDPAAVTLKRMSGNISVVKLNCAEARILDLTVANGGNAKVDGGNIYIDTNGGVVEHCILENGDSSYQYGKAGGGVYMKAGVVTRCIVRNCSANYNGGGGGIWMSGGQVESSLIIGCRGGAENGATYAGDAGGGVRLTGASAKLVNCTIVANRASTNPGVCVDYDSTTKAPKGSVVNCVIVDNLTMKGLWDFSNVGGTKDCGAAFVNCVTDARIAQPNETCLGAPFAFADRTGADYRLTASASAVDAGQAVELYSNLDLDGNPRVSGSAIDVGCYEFQQTSPVLAIALLNEEVLADSEVELAVASVGAIDGDVVWTIGNDEPVVGETTHTYTFNTAGLKMVKAEATIGGVPVSATVPLKVCPKVVYVDAASTTASEPFATPETATSDFTAGFAWATDGTVVKVAAGTYLVTTQALMKKGVVIEGLSGDPDDVTIKASGNTRLFWMSHPDAVLRHVTVSSGKATQSPGSNVYLDVFGGMVTNCVLTSGTADNYNAYGGNLVQLAGLVTHCRILNATVNNVGGGSKGGNVQIAGGVLAHSLIAGGIDATNGSSSGVTPGVRVGGTGELVNCTIAGQSAKGSSISGLIVASSTAKVTNCVIAGNVSASGGACWSGTAACLANCAVDAGDVPNETCIVSSAGTLLADASNGDYHPAPGAPSVDAGAALENPPATDLDGNVRVQGKGIDMGCYEYAVGTLAVTFDADIHEAICPRKITYTAIVDGVGEGAQLTYAWDFDGDGTVDQTTTEPVAVQTYERGGQVTVRVTVSDATSGLSACAVKQDLVKLAPRVIYVDAASENPQAPYDTWETAALQPKDAVEAAVDGCEIVVRAGTYALPQKLLVDKGVNLHGETGDPETVQLKAGAFTTLEVNHPQAVVNSVTLKDAVVSAAPGGVYFGSTGGMVTNCVISNCRTSNWSGDGGAASFNGPGVLTHSLITNCSADTWMGGGTKYVINAYRGRFENNLVIGCHSGGLRTRDDCAALLNAGDGAVVRNNTFVGNRITNRGLLSISSSATVENNVFADNTYLTSSDDVVSDIPSNDIGFNFGSSAKVEGQPVFVNCAADLSDPLNETCVSGTTGTFFKNYAKGDFTPAAGGPLCNAGAAWADAPATDLAGKPRVQGRSIDIGCYEAAPTGFVIIIQ